jgi:hypothetical protein
VNVTLLYFEGCPNWTVAEVRLTALSEALDLTVERRLVETPEEAEAAGFRGSPTILVEGRDPFATGDEPAGLACRIYQTPDGPQGAPTVEQLRAALV